MAIRVIIGEGHTLVREGTRQILQQSGDITVVGEAADGEEIVRLATGSGADVVLMDVALPRLDGIEATRRVKALCPATAVLIVSAHDDSPDVFASLEAGAAGYLLKTARGDDLIAAVRAVHAGESVLSPAVAHKVLRRFVPSGTTDSRAGKPELLTDRERQVLRLVARGLTNKAISKALSLSPSTVHVHLAHIYSKLGVASRTEAVVTAMRQGWLRVESVA